MHGCGPRCSVLSDISQESQFVVARTEVTTIKYCPANTVH